MVKDSAKNFKALTSYPVGSIREISKLSIPLMLSALSGALMLFFDRYILAHYSLSAMNAAASAGISAWVFQILIVGIASISEVFVGQHYGSKEYQKVATPVWQMIWFSLFSIIFFAPIAQFFPEAFVPERFHTDGAPYFKIILGFSWLIGVNVALTSFFIGRGKVTLVTITVIFGNILNILGDIVLIFGINGFIPAMGTTGAALATVISQVIQFGILFAFFITPSNRERFHTHKLSFNLYYFWECFKIGFPSALSHMIEFAAWSIQLHILASVSILYVTVATIGQSIFGLVAFTTEGLQKGVIAIASNLVGAKYLTPIKKVFRSAFVLHIIIACLIIIPLIINPEWLLDDFLSGETDPYTIQLVRTYTQSACFWIFLYFIFDGLVWIAAGFLTACKDTLFILFANAFNTWFFALLPTYWLIIVKQHTPDKAWVAIAFYGLINMLCFLFRFKYKFKSSLEKIE